jgi:hypothetical protein
MQQHKYRDTISFDEYFQLIIQDTTQWKEFLNYPTIPVNQWTKHDQFLRSCFLLQSILPSA